MARPTKRTPEVVAKIVKAIEGGAFDYIAAGQAGIHAETFREWIKCDPEFSAAIELARARARGIAEAEVFRVDPKFWLTKGPGRSKPDAEGWTDALAITGGDGGPVEIDVAGARDLLVAGLERLKPKPESE